MFQNYIVVESSTFVILGGNLLFTFSGTFAVSLSHKRRKIWLLNF